MKEPSAQEKVVAKLGSMQAAVQKAQKVRAEESRFLCMHGGQQETRRACQFLGNSLS